MLRKTGIESTEPFKIWYSQLSDQTSHWSCGWYMHRDRPSSKAQYFRPSVHKLAQLLRTWSLLVDSDLPAKVSHAGLAAVLGGGDGEGSGREFDLLARPHLSPFFHCHEFARRMRLKLCHRRFQQMYQVSCSLCLSLAPFWKILRPPTRLMHLVWAYVLQLPTPITFADWNVFVLTIKPWQS